MAFAIDASALHRPLGFEIPAAGGGSIQVERHAPERDGAAAAAILPADSIADAASRALREQLRRSAGVLRDAEMPGRDPTARAVASARGIVDGHRVSVLGFAAGRVAAPQREALQVLLLTDARLAPPMLEKLLSDVAARSFGSIAGIAIPRPSDRMVALANGVAGESELEPDSIGGTTLRVGAVALAQGLVRQLLETSFAPRRARLVQITVSGARDDEQATRAAEALAADEPTRAAMASEGPRDESVAALANPLAGASGASGSVRSSWSARADQAALRVDLGAGAGLATRWTAVAAR